MAKRSPSLTIQPNEELTALLTTWQQWKQYKDQATEEEMRYRLAVARALFSTGVREGTNNVVIEGVGKATLKYTINRKVDEGVLQAVTEAARAAGVNLDQLIRRKPELVVSEYRELTAEQRLIVDQFVTATPGSPAIEFTPVA